MKALFIGLGSIGCRHLRNLKQLKPDAVLLAFRQKNKPLPDDISQWEVSTYANLAAALQEQPDVAIIALPPALQAAPLQAVVDARVPFLIEKPISNTLEGLGSVAEKVEADGLVNMVAYNMRFHPCFDFVKSVLDRKLAGNLVHFYAQVGQYLPDWHPDENYRRGYSARVDLGGGVLMDLIHELDLTMALVGKPRRLFALYGKMSDLEIETEDCANILLEVEPQTIGVVHLDYVQRRPSRTLTLVGDKATIEVDFLVNSVQVFDKDRVLETYSEPSFVRNDMYLNLMSHFLESVETGSPTKIPFKHGVEVLRWALEAKRQF